MTQKQQKHLSKKELNEDPFFEEVAHIIAFFKKNQNALLIIAVALLVVIAGIFGTRAYIKSQYGKASGNFGIAMDYYNKNMLTDAEDQFLLLAEQYKRTDWGMRSYYYLGLISQKSGKSEDETLEYLEAFVDSKLKEPALKASAYQLIGTSYYRNGDMEAAGDNYLNAAQKIFSTAEKLNLGIRAGEAFIEAGNPEKLSSVKKYLGTLELNKMQQNRVEVLVMN